jgi:hypothetical protein
MNPQYRVAARDCVRLAKRAGDVSEKIILLNLAQAWVKLSELAATSDGREATPDQEVKSAT